MAVCRPTVGCLSADSFVGELLANRRLTVGGVSVKRWWNKGIKTKGNKGFVAAAVVVVV